MMSSISVDMNVGELYEDVECLEVPMCREIDYVVSDVHGRADLLLPLLVACFDDAATRNAKARFNFLGDVVDRGPRSRDCLDMVGEIVGKYEGSLYFMGNHEEMALDVLLSDTPDDIAVERWLGSGGASTLESYCHDLEAAFEMMRAIKADHVDLMRTAAYSCHRGRFFLCHAGIDPGLALSQQNNRTLTGVRADFMDYVGHLESVVIHGHTIVGDRPVVTENRVSIDTGAYRSGRLTACVIDGNGLRFLQTDGSGRSVVQVDSVFLDRGLGTCLDATSGLAA